MEEQNTKELEKCVPIFERSFGGLEPMKEEYRERRTLAQIETTIGDIRHAFRTICAGASRFRRLKGQESPSTRSTLNFTFLCDL
jgi:hypothetical protein